MRAETLTLPEPAVVVLWRASELALRIRALSSGPPIHIAYGNIDKEEVPSSPFTFHNLLLVKDLVLGS